MPSLKHIVSCATAAGVLVLLASCSSSSTEPTTMTVEQARKFLEAQATRDPATGKSLTFRVFGKGESEVRNISFTPERIKITTTGTIPIEGNTFLFAIRSLTPDAVCEDNDCLVSIIRKGQIHQPNYHSYEFALSRKGGTERIDKLYDALSTLKNTAYLPVSTDAQFEKVVDNYRSTSPKPTLPEEVQKLKTQAEAAVRDKRLADATDAYAQGLEIAPWWPEGRYQYALQLWEAKEYREAMDEMQCYLMLAPDADNSKAAQDKLDEWKDLTSQSHWYDF